MSPKNHFSRRRKNFILVRDLNIKLDSCETDRDIGIAQFLADYHLCDMHRHFKRSPQRGSTWHHKREEVVVSSMPDYFLYTDRRVIRKYRIQDPRHFVTDHKLVYGTLCSNTLKENKRYLKCRTRFPHHTLKYGPLLQMDSLYHNVEMVAIPPFLKLERASKLCGSQMLVGNWATREMHNANYWSPQSN